MKLKTVYLFLLLIFTGTTNADWHLGKITELNVAYDETTVTLILERWSRGLLKFVTSDGQARRKGAKKSSGTIFRANPVGAEAHGRCRAKTAVYTVIHEDFEPLSNAASLSAVEFQQTTS